MTISEPRSSIFLPTTHLSPPPSTTISEIYAEIEERISQAIVALRTCKNVSQNKIDEEFCVPVQQLRSQLNGNFITRKVRGTNLRKLASDQEKSLHNYFIQLDKISMLTCLYIIRRTTNSLL